MRKSPGRLYRSGLAAAIFRTDGTAAVTFCPMAKRFNELDLLRFLAACAVVMFHYTFRGYAAGHLSAVPYLGLAPLTKYGFLGVNFFFLISGFVILMTASGNSKRHFVVSRIVRLYPAFWICCSATFAFSLFFSGMRHVTAREYLLNLTMLGGFIGVPFVDSVYWSLLVEIRFYVLVLLILAIRQMHRAQEILGLWLLLDLVVFFHPVSHVSFLLVPGFAPYFIAGAMFFLIARDGPSPYRILVVGACGLLAIAEAPRIAAEMTANYHAPFSGVVIGAVLAACFAAFFLVSLRLTGRFAARRWLTLGALTYPLYLIHQNIGFALFNRGYPQLPAPILLVGVVALMLAAAFLVTRAERVCAPPFQRALWRMLGTPAAAAAPATAERPGVVSH